MSFRRAGALGVLVLLSCVPRRAGGERIVLDEDLMPITGTFSDLRVDERTRSLAGTEVRILVSDCGRFQAVLQFAEGEDEESSPSRVFVADLVSPDDILPVGAVRPPLLSGRSWWDAWVTIPAGSGRAAEGYAVVLDDRLELVLDFAGGREERFSLPRVRRGFFER